MKYFTIEELTRSTTARLRNIDNTPSQLVIDNLTALVDNVLDPLREAWGKPIKVNSGYRCRALNKAVGGVPASQHMLGQAADITGGSQEANRDLYSLLKRLNLPVDQAINEHDFRWLHISYSPRHRRHFFAIR